MRHAQHARAVCAWTDARAAAQLVREMDANSTAMRQRMDSINSYMRYRDLPEELQTRIRKYYSFYWSRQSIFDESALLHALPSHLRREVALYLHKEMISKVPFFRDADTSFITSLVTSLVPLQARRGGPLGLRCAIACAV